MLQVPGLASCAASDTVCTSALSGSSSAALPAPSPSSPQALRGRRALGHSRKVRRLGSVDRFLLALSSGPCSSCASERCPTERRAPATRMRSAGTSNTQNIQHPVDSRPRQSPVPASRSRPTINPQFFFTVHCQQTRCFGTIPGNRRGLTASLVDPPPQRFNRLGRCCVRSTMTRIDQLRRDDEQPERKYEVPQCFF